MFLSEVPEPEAKIFLYVGFHANAFTAALCSPSLFSKHLYQRSHTISQLSFPPEAIKFPSKENLSPQISYQCPTKLKTGSKLCYLTSKSQTILSFEPAANKLFCQPREPVLQKLICSSKRTLFVAESVINSFPEASVTASYVPCSLYAKEHIQFYCSSSYSLKESVMIVSLRTSPF